MQCKFWLRINLGALRSDSGAPRSSGAGVHLQNAPRVLLVSWWASRSSQELSGAPGVAEQECISQSTPRALPGRLGFHDVVRPLWQGIGSTHQPSWLVAEGEVEVQEEKGPMHLLAIELLSIMEVGEILMVHEDLELLCCTFKEVAPLV